MMVTKLFIGMIRVTMEAYVDDMMVESVKGDNHIEDLRKTFETMCLHKVRLNPVKCNFGIQHAKF